MCIRHNNKTLSPQYKPYIMYTLSVHSRQCTPCVHRARVLPINHLVRTSYVHHTYVVRL